MRIARFQKRVDENRNYLGLVLSEKAGSRGYVLDLHTGAIEANIPVSSTDPILTDMISFLQDLDRSKQVVLSVQNWADTKIAKGDIACFIPETEVRWLPPVPTPTKIVGMGGNFLDHLKEANQDRILRGEPEIPLPSTPAAFLKAHTCLIGHNENIPYPRETKELDYEGEIGVVIGREAHNIDAKDAMQYVAGYVICNDISARDIQLTEMKSGTVMLSKNFPGFGPMGRELVFTDEIPDPQALDIVTYVNGQIRQKGNTKEMHFAWKQLISYWSKLRLVPGDIILSGTPSGVAMGRDEWYLRKGDLVEVEVPGLGRLSNRIV